MTSPGGRTLACRSFASPRWWLVLALASQPVWLAAQAPGRTGPAMPDGRRALHVDATIGNQRSRMDDCVGCPGGRADPVAQLALAVPVTRRLLVGAARVGPPPSLCALDDHCGPLVAHRSTRAFVRWWPRRLGPAFLQAAAGRMRYRFEEDVTPSFQAGRLVRLRGTELGATAGASVPLIGTTLGMTPFVTVWRVPDARGTRRTQAGVDVRHETRIRGWQAGLALTLRVR